MLQEAITNTLGTNEKLRTSKQRTVRYREDPNKYF